MILRKFVPDDFQANFISFKVGANLLSICHYQDFQKCYIFAWFVMKK